jgi:hypothetical protein
MFLVPCQSRFEGLLVQELDDSIRVAVIVAKTAIPCGGLPTKEILTLSGYKFDKPLEPYVDNLGKGRLQPAGSIRLHLPHSPEGSDRENLVSIMPSLDFWQSSCATFVGVLLRPSRSGGQDTVEALHYFGKTVRGDCQTQPQNVSLAFIPDQQFSNLRTPLAKSRGQSKPAAQWRLVPVELSKDRAALRLSALLSCGDYLVGLVALDTQSARQTVAALVVHHPRLTRSGHKASITCDKKQVSLDLSGLQPKNSKVLVSIQREIPLQGQQIIAPNLQYRQQDGFSLSQSLLPGCNKAGLQVYGVDLQNNLVLGILTQSKLASCYSSLQQGHKRQDLVFEVESRYGSQGISPMRLQHQPR